MTTNERCESCGMPLAERHTAAHYCEHCAPDGVLQSFEERFERMTQWMIRTEGLDRDTAAARTRDHMRTMPAWRDHPALG
jgi:hypothetical protein